MYKKRNSKQEGKTFRAIYESLDPMPPKKRWVLRVANAACVSEMTVRMWLSGRQKPQEGIRKLVAEELQVPAEQLWP